MRKPGPTIFTAPKGISQRLWDFVSSKLDGRSVSFANRVYGAVTLAIYSIYLLVMVAALMFAPTITFWVCLIFVMIVVVGEIGSMIRDVSED